MVTADRRPCGQALISPPAVVGLSPKRLHFGPIYLRFGAGRHPIDFTMSSTIFLASARSIIVLSR